ncbi:reverse transcriptase domain, Reverse transcriptase zinc-binding domain protein [Artemisia annua]|uniref:Reverse transcriptase domain, Reverse transcriptase zinc-binding domain protein n=1 Tax=Artemisia annua TaxID=35608 RepID=A0A2U1L5I2_ARTAN|nr:reverse transcriptase domain, Reverse transcriptase zinc-binding domain protein [Artemisia annua]
MPSAIGIWFGNWDGRCASFMIFVIPAVYCPEVILGILMLNKSFRIIQKLYNLKPLQRVWENGDDCWKWEGDKDGIFTVNKAKKVIADRQMSANVSKLKWVGWTPLKCNIMVWRADLNRLPTRVELVKRGIQLDNELCPLCVADQETSTHLFT